LRPIHHTAGNSWTLCCRGLPFDHHHGLDLCHLVSKNAEYPEMIVFCFGDTSSGLQVFLGSEWAKGLSWKKRYADPSIVQSEPVDEHCEFCPSPCCLMLRRYLA
jgi:hypothetical protein